MLDTLARSVRTAIRTTRAAVRHLREDVQTARAKDPAAGSTVEVLTYPGIHAVWVHRIEHRLWGAGFELTARLSSQLTRFFTGVEIHPAADIGRRVFVDHGMGVVIGETAAVGDDVLMYHGVTLGGGSMRREKRHPTIGDDVTLGANATLVGDISVGEGATVGAGSVVVEDVPPGVTVAGNPAQVVGRDGAGVKPYGVERASNPHPDETSDESGAPAESTAEGERATDDGTTEDESTEDESTDGGATEDGTTEDGSTEDGPGEDDTLADDETQPDDGTADVCC